jgi:tRNA threonylcarbamoyladenosine biosynthesis protein TsaB
VRVLAMDTSCGLGGVAVAIDGVIAASIESRRDSRHGEALLSQISQAMAEAGLERASIDLIAVGIGPGSFTGTRVGVATAKGLSLALDRPLVGVSSLLAIATAAPGRFIAPVLDAHKGEVYASLYERIDGALVERLAPIHAAPAEAARALGARDDICVCGSGLRRYPELGEVMRPLAPVFDDPRAAIIAHLGAERLVASGPDDRASLEPLYVRASDAKRPDEIARE